MRITDSSSHPSRNAGAQRGVSRSNATATTTLRSIARVGAVPELAYSAIDSTTAPPLPREFNIVDSARDTQDYLIPLSADDDLDVLVAPGHAPHQKQRGDELWTHSASSKHQRHQLKEFETVEALLRDATAIEGDSHSDSDTVSGDDDEHSLHVLKELNQLGSRIEAARRAKTNVTNSSATSPHASQPAQFLPYEPQQVSTPSALFLLEKEASSLLSYSLSNPQMRMFAREVLQRRTTVEVAPGATSASSTTIATAVHHQHSSVTATSPTPVVSAPTPLSATQDATIAAAGVLSGMNTTISQAIANQQVALGIALEEHRKKQEVVLSSHREAIGNAQLEASAKANAALTREINALRRQQQELLRQQQAMEQERRHEGGRTAGLAVPSALTVDGGIGDTDHRHHHRGHAAPAESAAAAQVRNIPQETATLIAGALQTERTKMADERRQWERAMQQVQEGAVAQQQALLKQMKVLSGQQEAAVQQATAHALHKAQTTHEKHTQRIAKLMELQQRQHVHDLRVDSSITRQQQQQAAATSGGGAKRPGSLNPAQQLISMATNAVAAEIQLKKDQLAASKSEGSESSPAALQSILLDTTGSEVQASDLMSTTTRRQVSEAATGTGMRLGAVLPRKAKPSKAVITPSPASPIPRKEDLSASAHQHDGAHSKPKSSKTRTAPGSPSGTTTSSSSPLPATTDEPNRGANASDGVPADRNRVASFLDEATKALVDGGAVADTFLPSSSDVTSPIPLIILTDARHPTDDIPSPATELSEELKPVQCVEMCVAMFMSEDRAAELVGAPKRNARDPLAAAPRLLTREEAELLVDARKRLQRIRAFSIDFRSPHDDGHDDDNDESIPCHLGEQADTLLLNAITKKLVHEVLAENIRGFLHDFERSQQADVNGDGNFNIFPSTGSQGLDRVVLEECLQELLHIPPVADLRNTTAAASTADPKHSPAQQQQSASKLPPGVMDLLRLHANQQTDVIEQALWQEWMLAQAECQRDQHKAFAGDTTVRVPLPGGVEASPAWLTDDTNVATQQPQAQPMPHHHQAATVINVVVDTSSIADLLRNWGGPQPAVGEPPQLLAVSSASPRYLQQESLRHPQIEEELPHIESESNTAPWTHKTASLAPTTPFNLDDVEAAVTERILRKLYGAAPPSAMVPPPNFGAWLPGFPPVLGAPPPNLQNVSENELSGVSSASSSSSTSSSSSSSSSGDSAMSPAFAAFLQSPQVQTVFSTEAVQRYRYYSDVDQVFTFLREAFAEEHSKIVRGLSQRLPFTGMLPTTTNTSGQHLQGEREHQQQQQTATTATTGTITDPITSFLVEWFKNLQVHELPSVLQKQLSLPAAVPPPPTTLASLYDAAGRHEQQRIDGRPLGASTLSASVISSTNPSSFGDDGMHKFTRYLPADYVENLHHPERMNGGTHLRPWRRRHDDTVTTETTLVETDTTVTTIDGGHIDSSSDFQRVYGVPNDHVRSSHHYYPQHHQPHHLQTISPIPGGTYLQNQDTSTSTETHTTISSVSSDDVRRTLARGVMHQMTSHQSHGGYHYGGRQMAPSLNQSELTAGSRL
jgi:hypothetical protein